MEQAWISFLFLILLLVTRPQLPAVKADSISGLLSAIQEGNVTEQLLQSITITENGTSIANSRFYNRHNITLLMFAVSNSNDGAKQVPAALRAQFVKVLLENGADVNAVDDVGRFALLLAVDSGDKNMVSLLLKFKADPNKVRPVIHYTSLMLAAEKGFLGIVKQLLEAGALVNTMKNLNNDTALQLAASNGNSAVVLELIQRGGADVNSSGFRGRSALYDAAMNRHVDTVTALIEQGADVNQKTNSNENYTPLMVAAEMGDLDVVRQLIFAGAEIDAKNSYNSTTLNHALKNYNRSSSSTLATIECLLAEGADVNNKGYRGRSALYDAAVANQNETVALLLRWKADVDSRSSEGFTPLMAAAEVGHLEIVRLLLDAGGADVNAKSKYNTTALIHASKFGHVDVAKQLLQRGADINARGERGRTALYTAVMYGRNETVAVLLQWGGGGIKVDDASDDNDKFTPLMVAAEQGFLTIVKLLIKAGADVDAKNNEGKTAANLAANKGRTEIVQELNSHKS